jgi:fatty-acyl-CoA synthase
VVKNGEGDVSPSELKAFLDGKIAKWWIPDDVQYIEEMPHTATGKIQKMKLREMFDDYQFPA